MSDQAIHQCDLTEAKQFFQGVLSRSLGAEALKWLNEKIAKTQSLQDFYLAFSACPRFVGNSKLVLTEKDSEDANSLRAGLNLSGYDVDRAARVLLVISFPQGDKQAYLRATEMLFSCADLKEQVALYSALPLFPYPEEFIARAAEGVRTNMRDVFDAVALDNPYPADYFPEDAWNQMVLKAVFTERPLARIYGIDSRVNPRLSAMLVDFANERRSAGRSVPEELWRCVMS